MHHAYVYRNLKLTAYLETCGADTMIKNNKGKTPAEVGHDYTDTRGVRGGEWEFLYCGKKISNFIPIYLKIYN